MRSSKPCNLITEHTYFVVQGSAHLYVEYEKKYIYNIYIYCDLV